MGDSDIFRWQQSLCNLNHGCNGLIDLVTGTVSTRSTPSRPQGISIAPDGTIYITDGESGNVNYYNADFSYGGQISVGVGVAPVGNFIKKSQPCTADPVTFTITVNPASTATITNGPVSGDISSCIGAASASPFIQQFKVTGTGLTDNITATAPTGFELSLAPASGYANSVSVLQSGGTVGEVRVYIRSAATASGGYISGTVALASTGTPVKYVGVNGWVNKLPAVNNPGDKIVAKGETLPAINLAGTANIYRWTNDNPSIGLAASGEGDISSFTAINTGSTPVVANIRVTPVPAQLAYITNFNDNTVSVVDIAGSRVLKTIPVGKSPNGVAVTRDGSMVFVSNYDSNDISVISPFSNTVIKTITVGQNPSAITVSPDGSRLYVANNGTNKVAIISTATFKTLDIITVGENPNGLIVSHDGTRLYVLNYGSLSISVIDVASNAIVATMTIMNSPALDFCLSPDDSKLYISTPSFDDILVYSTVTNSLETKIKPPYGLRYLAISPDGNTLYGNTGLVMDIPTSTFKPRTPAYSQVTGFAISADGQLLLTTNDFENNLTIVNTASNAVVGKVTVGKFPLVMGNFIKENPGCDGQPIDFKITVNSTNIPLITATPATGTISVCSGNVSSGTNTQQFKVSGTNLSAGITGNAPAGFEISLTANGGYGTAVTMPQTNGKVSNTVVYVRSVASNTPGTISGDVILSSVGAENTTVRVAAFINALPAVNDPGNQVVDNGSMTKPVSFTGVGNIFTWTNDNPSIGLAASGTGDISAFTASNTGTGQAIATITVTPKIKGFAYISSALDNTISVVDPADRQIVKTTPVGQYPYGVVVSPDGTRVYVSNILDKSMSVISTITNDVIATFPVGDHPLGISISPDGSRIYVANEESNNVSVINASTNSVMATIPVGIYPTFTLISPDGSRLYVGNQNSQTISVFNTVNNALVTNIPTAGREPSQMAVSPDGALLYAVTLGTYDNFVLVISTTTNSVVKSILVGKTPHGITITPDGSKLYVANTSDNNVSVINTSDNAVAATIAVGVSPTGISVTPDGDFVYVANETPNAQGTVSVIGTAINQVLYTFVVGHSPVSFGNFIAPGVDCAGDPVSFTITVNPPPQATLSASGTLLPLTTIYGTPSSSESFTVSGTNIISGVSIAEPAGFEVSADNLTFNSTATVAGTGTIPATPVYIRLTSKATVGTYGGDILVSTGAATFATVVMPNSTVTPAPLIITADNKTKAFGAVNPSLTVSYSGFVNNDNATKLSRQPSVSTSATTASEAGDYPIIASDAAALNYTFSYLPGVLTIGPSVALVSIPNTFTPNGDGINDTWNLQFLQGYPKSTVNILNRWGDKVYSSIGYGVPWDGRLKNILLPSGTYYYVINRKDGQPVMSGWVALVR
ncbi:beta-propeller fold lactonase family protein [Mucilaginibacter gilvus]|uniref:T9SS type B sorting domain-containing protein n=1 Tax=Mucilaginibacter gilvus TaxID=2305909 RepID=A0A444MQL8_9SPHI|nr:beta-propeller fold lactonase family protein [Mucilaginibacter gilvus]RWY53907.1 T9SS type B sorting domain-containing protein [Mucilaginibacter gilvus]